MNALPPSSRYNSNSGKMWEGYRIKNIRATRPEQTNRSKKNRKDTWALERAVFLGGHRNWRKYLRMVMGW
jgi:hypothetical protein